MKAILVAAWRGTRMLPITKTIPKEMLPIWDKPVIQYIVEDIVNANIQDILMITSQQKKALEDYFDKNYELEDLLEKGGKTEFLNLINKPQNLANYTFIKQTQMLGTGHAVKIAQPRITDDYFMVIFSDCIYPPQMFNQMIEQFNKNPQPILACHQVPKEEVYKYGIVSTNDKDQVLDFVEKPTVEEAPGNLIRNWVAILPKEIFQKIDQVKTDSRTWETNLPDAIKLLKEDVDILAMGFRPYRDIWNIQARMDTNNELYTKWKLFS